MTLGRYLKALGVVATVVAFSAGAASANDFASQITDVLSKQVRPWLSDPTVIEAVKAQNAETAGLSEAEIDALDKQWRAEAEAGSGPLIDKVLAGKLSAFLKKKKAASDGLYSEVFVMDAKGLNVGQSDVTSDYMQGDEDKWQKTYPVGPDAVFIDEVEFDDSSGQFQSQVNATIADPATGQAIGAITIGINVEKLD
ncbi:hypothetical protein [Thalassobaculum litoreum]|uniref:Uncharacterized protein n=1 Tax=Thalassobaculum litoreum DSM 18839 TaxID=1123362 RepID=A0A8G2EVG5_9PROT|nr:hypothetical protein [Thalassobaculum litoreum]SDF27315.1 hypothetical protein SAMN05660686_00847 [Thalassobaculum litoreum DSM 18839]